MVGLESKPQVSRRGLEQMKDRFGTTDVLHCNNCLVEVDLTRLESSLKFGGRYTLKLGGASPALWNPWTEAKEFWTMGIVGSWVRE